MSLKEPEKLQESTDAIHCVQMYHLNGPLDCRTAFLSPFSIIIGLNFHFGEYTICTYHHADFHRHNYRCYCSYQLERYSTSHSLKQAQDCNRSQGRAHCYNCDLKRNCNCPIHFHRLYIRLQDICGFPAFLLVFDNLRHFGCDKRKNISLQLVQLVFK